MKYTFIYRVVGESGLFVSAWVRTKKQANAIKKDVESSPIFGGDTYHIEESSMLE